MFVRNSPISQPAVGSIAVGAAERRAPNVERAPSAPLTNRAVQALDPVHLEKIIKKGDLPTIRKVLTRAELANLGYLPMDYAVKAGRKEVVDYFLAEGAAVSSQAAFDATCRHSYEKKQPCWIDVLERFIATHDEIPATFLASALTKWDDEKSARPVVDLLIAHRAPDDGEVIARAANFEFDGLPLLLQLGYKPSENALAWARNRSAFDLLLQYNAPIHHRAIESLAREGKNEEIAILLQRGAAVTNQALIEAAENGHLDTLKLLVNSGKASLPGPCWSFWQPRYRRLSAR